jgi:hypothetical protein
MGIAHASEAGPDPSPRVELRTACANVALWTTTVFETVARGEHLPGEQVLSLSTRLLPNQMLSKSALHRHSEWLAKSVHKLKFGAAERRTSARNPSVSTRCPMTSPAKIRSKSPSPNGNGSRFKSQNRASTLEVHAISMLSRLISTPAVFQPRDPVFCWVA